MARRRTNRWQAGAVGCAVGLLLGLAAGCGSDPPGAAARKDVTEASPLAEFLGTPPRSQRGLPHLDAEEIARQDTLTGLVADCMTEAGFAYEAVPLAQRLGEPLLEAYALEPAEFARRYGYGATTLQVEPYDDPNEPIRAALDPTRQAAYDEALWGGGATGDGCYLQASSQVYGDAAEREAEYAEFDDLVGQLNEVYEQIDAHPRLQEAHRRWARCVADAGHPGFGQPSDARRSVFEQLPGGSPAGGSPAGSLDEVDPQRLAELRAYELELAPVDFECARAHVLGTRRAVTLALEQQFLDAHRAELTRYRDWLATGD